MPALAYAIQLMSALPALVQAGKDISSLVTDGTKALESMQKDKRDPTVAEWNDLNNRIMALRNQLHAD